MMADFGGFGEHINFFDGLFLAHSCPLIGGSTRGSRASHGSSVFGGNMFTDFGGFSGGFGSSDFGNGFGGGST